MTENTAEKRQKSNKTIEEERKNKVNKTTKENNPRIMESQRKNNISLLPEYSTRTRSPRVAIKGKSQIE